MPTPGPKIAPPPALREAQQVAMPMQRAVAPGTSPINTSSRPTHRRWCAPTWLIGSISHCGARVAAWHRCRPARSWWTTTCPTLARATPGQRCCDRWLPSRAPTGMLATGWIPVTRPYATCCVASAAPMAAPPSALGRWRPRRSGGSSSPARTIRSLELLIPRSKTDAEAEGARIGIPRGKAEDTCPVRALQAWLKGAGIEHGPCSAPSPGTAPCGRLR